MSREYLPDVFSNEHCAWKIIEGPKEKDLGCWGN